MKRWRSTTTGEQHAATRRDAASFASLGHQANNLRTVWEVRAAAALCALCPTARVLRGVPSFARSNDVILAAACREDVDKFCAKVEPGAAASCGEVAICGDGIARTVTLRLHARDPRGACLPAACALTVLQTLWGVGHLALGECAHSCLRSHQLPPLAPRRAGEGRVHECVRSHLSPPPHSPRAPPSPLRRRGPRA